MSFRDWYARSFPLASLTMQLLSPMPMLAASTAPALHPRYLELLRRSDIHTLTILLGVYLVIDLLVGIACFWIGSKAVAASDRSAFVNALKLWASYLIGSFRITPV